VRATAIFTGLRIGEVLGLTWADVDLQAGLVHVRCQVGQDGRARTVEDREGAPLGRADADAGTALARAPAALGTLARTDAVFGQPDGAPLMQATCRYQLRSAALRPGLRQNPEQPRLRLHDLRHTFASLLIAQGTNVVFVSRQLGNASPNTTLGFYAHLFDRAEHAKRTSDLLEASFAHVLSRV
jgi:integrase